MAKTDVFEKEYKKLNKAQKEAVDTIDGPVMVIAGPGTGKTQILALRIAHILQETAKADEILCLTFTNSAVKAMRERLQKYIGVASSQVNVSTFHSFGLRLIEDHYRLLDLDFPPKLMEDSDVVSLFDEILEGNDWEHLRPRSDRARYFKDLRSLISVLKRERISPGKFLIEIEKDIKKENKDENNISTRGESKGKLKKEVEKKIEGLERTKEAVKFFELYEKIKKEKNLFDYDDVLESAVLLVEGNDEVREFLRVNYQYILVDEHQDSSGVQNSFLEKVWAEVEKPNIFVVGDDRQLIYGFGGASLEYFENFKSTFGRAKLITLTENYRSTQDILDVSHLLLKSSLSLGKLKSNTKEKFPLRLVEADYPRDEILACALDIKEKIKKGLDINDCAILMPKNAQVRSAVAILRDLNLPVSSYDTLRLFDNEEAQAFLRVLRIINDPYDAVSLSLSFFDSISGIPPLQAHKFLKEQKMKNFSLPEMAGGQSLFESPAMLWVKKLLSFVNEIGKLNILSLVQKIGDEVLLSSAKDHETLVARVEIIRTIIHLVLSQLEKNSNLTLAQFLSFIERLESYNEDIKLAVFGAEEGIKVLTLHSSKGLEFDYVWIAHLDEGSFMLRRKSGFALPERVKERLEERDENTAKRELYVALTRAKRYANISYARHSYGGRDQTLAHIVSDIGDVFEKQNSAETEKIILKHDPKAYVEKKRGDKKVFGLKDLTELVAKEYPERNISVSALNNFFECPWKWYFRNLLQLPEEKSESLEFGDKVHKAIDQILKSDKKISEKDLEKITNGDKKVEKVLVDWVKNRLPQISLNRENEQSVSFPDKRFPHLSIYGRIDLIEKLDTKNVRVTDFKTGSAKKKSEIEKLDDENRLSNLMRQLAMYSYLLQGSPKWRGVDVRESRLEFIEAKNTKEAIYDHIVSPAEVDLLVKDIKDYDQMLKNGSWAERECHYNSYGKGTACEYCKMAEIYKS